MRRSYLWICILAGLLYTTCEKPPLEGSDFIEPDRVDLTNADTLTLQSKNLVYDSLLVYRDSIISIPFRHLVGKINQGDVGTTESWLYLQLNPVTNSKPFVDSPDIVYRIDSLVLSLAVDTLYQYGLASDMHSLEVKRLSEPIVVKNGMNVRSDQVYAVENDLLGVSNTFNTFPPPAPTFYEYNNATGEKDTVSRVQVRIPMPISLANEFFQMDTSVWKDHKKFVDQFKGIRVRDQLAQNSMIAISSFNATNTRMTLYYSENDSIQKEYIFIVGGGPAISHFENTITGTPMEQAQIGGLSTPLYIKGLGGGKISISIPNAQALHGNIINYAILEIYADGLINAPSDIHPPIKQLLAYTKDADGKEKLIRDCETLIVKGGDFLPLYFGGVPVKQDPDLYRYRLNLSGVLQQIIDGELNDEIILAPHSPTYQPNFVKFYGTGSGMYAPKLYVKLTKL